MSDNDLLSSLRTSFLDQGLESREELRARLVVNEESEGCSVLNEIEDNLQDCEEFAISVAFMTLSGLTPLLMALSELMKPRADGKTVRGRILTTDYLSFTEPAALKRLADFPNIEVRMFRTCEVDHAAAGFHTKGYIFRSGTQFRFLIGSSNLTAAALKSNHEWNVRLVAGEKGEITRRILDEFEMLWKHKCTHPVEDIIDDYSLRYERQQTVRAEIAAAADNRSNAGGLKPNSMQLQLIAKLGYFMKEPLENDEAQNGSCARRALLISATGTGKTYASAFAVRSLGPRRILFLVHREQIARKSQQSYRNVLGEDYKYGFLIASDRSALELRGERCAVFATMQSMVNALDPQFFAPDSFDVIVIDEVHHAGAQSYKSIMDYFRPHLWLGMTATPDRPDAENIYALFHHQILLDLRLQQALEQDLLCPFHYFGISELIVDEVRAGDTADFAKLTSDARVQHILENIERYGFSGRRVKGLIFCSSNKEAEELSGKFNARGLRTLALSGNDSSQKREEAIARLTTDASRISAGTPLDYLLTVDIFNEGVDIPEVNQVVLLRQTKSPIVFVQQLGRGLRKSPGKEFVVVLDFIGNYDNNYMIPVALSGDRSYQKDAMRKTVVAGIIPGNSTVHFDAVARERIFRAIDSARTDSMELLKNAYRLLKYQLGRVPSLRDFDEHGSIDAVKFFTKAESYVEFLYRVEKENEANNGQLSNPDRPRVSSVGREMLRYLSQKIGFGQRPSEAIVLEEILKGTKTGLKEKLICRLQNDFNLPATSEEHLDNCFKVLTNNFARNKDEQKRFEHAVFLTQDATGDWLAAPEFLRVLNANDDFRHHLADLVAFVKDRFLKRFSQRYRDTAFKLYERYTYDDVCRLLNWQSNMPATNIGGYRYDSGTKTLPVFINYDKTEGDINYHDHFESPREIIALSKTNRSIGSSDADHIYKRTQNDRDNRIYLFVRKNKNDNEVKSFYFLGEVSAQDSPTPIKIDEEKPAFEIRYRLDEPVRNDIYTYLTH